MKTTLLSLCTTLCMLLAGKAFAYSHDGHYLVGGIADHLLTSTPNQAKVQALIADVPLAVAANFADDIKNWDPKGSKHNLPFRATSNDALNTALEQFLHANQTVPDCSGELLHHEYHYTDVQVADASGAYGQGQVGVNDHDIVQMIGFCIDVLTGKKGADNPQKITPPVALVLLAHYVGDLHQPLHVGAEYFNKRGKVVNPNSTSKFSGDIGGNVLTLALPNRSDTHPTNPSNLHHYWDFNAVATATNRWANQNTPTGSSRLLDQMAAALAGQLPVGWSAEPVIDPATFASQCANEILPIAREAHQRLTFSGVKVNGSGPCSSVVKGTATALPQSNYEEYPGGVALDEIQKAGHRLADLLAAVLK
jgi:hypothetical protein